MSATHRLDLSAIERALRKVQSRFAELSTQFTEPRDPLTDEVLHNVLEGYALVDDYVARGVDLFDLHHLDLMLEINATEHLAATEEHFFNNVEGGIKDLFNWYCAYRSESVWKRAAGVYVRILSKPQLFIEGNNRSGSLIVSYLLMRAGLPPFVLTLENAEGYFNPSSVIRNSAKHGVKALYELPKIKKKYAAFLEEQAPDPKAFFLNDAPQPIYQGGH